MGDPTARVRAHFEARWGRPLRLIDWAEGRRSELPEAFRVGVFRHPEAAALVYATLGMSDDDGGLELFLLVREHDDDRMLAELLFAVAHYHRTACALNLGDSVNFGRPWLGDSLCTRGLLSLPYLDGPSIEHVPGSAVRVLWLIPVTDDELRFRREHGTDALETRFEETNFDYLDPHRRSVVDVPSIVPSGKGTLTE